jgi:hypothetical protein
MPRGSHRGSNLRGNELHLHEVVENFLETTPGGTETAPRRDFFGQWSDTAASHDPGVKCHN